jgi:hypothetical protein
MPNLRAASLADFVLTPAWVLGTPGLRLSLAEEASSDCGTESSSDQGNSVGAPEEAPPVTAVL